MKKVLLFILIFLSIPYLTFSQWTRTGSNVYTTTSRNYVGIGTSTPNSKLTVTNRESSIGWNFGNHMAFFNRTVDVSGSPHTASLGIYAWPDVAMSGTSAANENYLRKSAMLYVTGEAVNLELFTREALKFNVGPDWTIGNERMRITNAGTVGIGTTTPSSNYRLDISGVVRATGGVITSDERFKANITPVGSILTEINKLNGVSYNYRTDEFQKFNFSKSKQIGFLAQNVQKVFPELVSSDDEGYLSVNYIGIIPILVEAVKEQNSIIDAKNKELELLNNRLALVESAIRDLQSKTIDENPNVGKLGQNYPNPTQKEAIIDFDISVSTKQALVVVRNMQGLEVKRQDIISRGKGNMTIGSNNFVPGVYIYSLIADNKVIDTKKMVIAQ